MCKQECDTHAQAFPPAQGQQISRPPTLILEKTANSITQAHANAHAHTPFSGSHSHVSSLYEISHVNAHAHAHTGSYYISLNPNGIGSKIAVISPQPRDLSQYG